MRTRGVKWVSHSTGTTDTVGIGQNLSDLVTIKRTHARNESPAGASEPLRGSAARWAAGEPVSVVVRESLSSLQGF